MFLKTNLLSVVKEKHMGDEINKSNKNTNEPETNELEKCRKQAEEYLNNWKRERADFINYKKDEGKRLEEFVKFANESLILEWLDIVDDLELAAKHEANPESIKRIIKKTDELLKKYGVERIKTGREFDPNLHEAVSTEEGGDKIEELRAGYTMRGKVIRPARVKIIQ